jgi:TRAP-type C4-dicarboxylate transport system permease small subunit
MKFYFISNLVVFVAVTVQQRVFCFVLLLCFFFFFPLLVYGVSNMEASGENFVNFVWN